MEQDGARLSGLFTWLHEAWMNFSGDRLSFTIVLIMLVIACVLLVKESRKSAAANASFLWKVYIMDLWGSYMAGKKRKEYQADAITDVNCDYIETAVEKEGTMTRSEADKWYLALSKVPGLEQLKQCIEGRKKYDTKNEIKARLQEENRDAEGNIISAPLPKEVPTATKTT